MATVTKDFKVKNGIKVQGDANLDGSLYVGGPNATVNGSEIITEEIITGGTQTNISVSYNSATKTLDFVAENGVADSDTDDLVEGETNLYFTDTRAKESAAELLTGATLENITITGDENGLTITAENGVADSTTDDLAEGTTNLYYTDERARGAVSAGEGLSYNSASGEFLADLGSGLQFDENGQIEIDNNVVATQTDLSDDISSHSNTTSGVHGVTGDVVGTVDAQTLTNKTLGSGTTLDSALNANSKTITNLPEPTQASDAATKAYVDAVAEGLHVHASVAAATTGPVDLATGGLLLQIDGVQLVAGNRVLVKDQESPAENGIYVVAAGSWARAEDYDSADEVQAGDFVFVSAGTSYLSTGWVQINPVSTLGTDPIVWDQFSGAGTYLAGNGLELNGSTFEIDTDITATKSYVDEEIDSHTELTTAHGVAGDIVGTSDTQTLTNKTLGAGTVLGASLDGTNTYKVVNLVDPSSAQDAATKNYVDSNFVTTDNLSEQLEDYIPLTQKAANDGVATLDSTGQVPLSQLGNVTEAIDGLTTADVDEDSSNLYFTDARAVSALEAVVPNFTEIEYNSVAKQVAATSSLTGTGTNIAVYAFPSSEYRSAKFLIKLAYGTHTEISEVLLTLDTSDNVAITEYAIVGTNGSLGNISAEHESASGDVLLLVNTANSTVVNIVGTLLA
jgi:hypothetical protein